MKKLLKKSERNFVRLQTIEAFACNCTCGGDLTCLCPSCTCYYPCEAGTPTPNSTQRVETSSGKSKTAQGTYSINSTKQYAFLRDL